MWAVGVSFNALCDTGASQPASGYCGGGGPGYPSPGHCLAPQRCSRAPKCMPCCGPGCGSSATNRLPSGVVAPTRCLLTAGEHLRCRKKLKVGIQLNTLPPADGTSTAWSGAGTRHIGMHNGTAFVTTSAGPWICTNPTQVGGGGRSCAGARPTQRGVGAWGRTPEAMHGSCSAPWRTG